MYYDITFKTVASCFEYEKNKTVSITLISRIYVIVIQIFTFEDKHKHIALQDGISKTYSNLAQIPEH